MRTRKINAYNGNMLYFATGFMLNLLPVKVPFRLLGERQK
jgi:hypothetical protein